MNFGTTEGDRRFLWWPGLGCSGHASTACPMLQEIRFCTLDFSEREVNEDNKGMSDARGDRDS